MRWRHVRRGKVRIWFLGEALLPMGGWEGDMRESEHEWLNPERAPAKSRSAEGQDVDASTGETTSRNVRYDRRACETVKRLQQSNDCGRLKPIRTRCSQPRARDVPTTIPSCRLMCPCSGRYMSMCVHIGGPTCVRAGRDSGPWRERGRPMGLQQL